MSAPRAVIRLAAQLHKEGLAYKAEYEAECESYRREGYRPRYCPHGTNQWTDWDNICGPCEDGWYPWDMETALAEAHRRTRETHRRVALMTPLYGEAGLPRSVKDALFDWAIEPTKGK
jgi:hypothetical protein